MRPTARHIKLNVDASFHEDAKAGAIGAVLRDYKGEFVAASTLYLSNVASVVMAEAIAMREGLSLAILMGCNRIMAESDSAEVIETCTGTEGWWSEPSAIYADCIDKVA
jgi:ribonuclease HI